MESLLERAALLLVVGREPGVERGKLAVVRLRKMMRKIVQRSGALRLPFLGVQVHARCVLGAHHHAEIFELLLRLRLRLPLGGEQLALGRPAPEALDPMFDPKIPRPEDVTRANSKVKRGSFTSGVPSEDESLQRRPDAEDIEAARALHFAGAVAEEDDAAAEEDDACDAGAGAAPLHDGPNDDDYDGQSFGAGSAVSGVSYGSGL